jgi:hypothetical protein
MANAPGQSSDRQVRDLLAVLDITRRLVPGRAVSTYSQLLEHYRFDASAEEPSHAS